MIAVLQAITGRSGANIDSGHSEVRDHDPVIGYGSGRCSEPGGVSEMD